MLTYFQYSTFRWMFIHIAFSSRYAQLARFSSHKNVTTSVKELHVININLHDRILTLTCATLKINAAQLLTHSSNLCFVQKVRVWVNHFRHFAQNASITFYSFFRQPRRTTKAFQLFLQNPRASRCWLCSN